MQQTTMNHPIAWGWDYFSIFFFKHALILFFPPVHNRPSADKKVLYSYTACTGLQHRILSLLPASCPGVLARKSTIKKTCMSDNPHHYLFFGPAKMSSLDHFLLNECPFVTGFETLFKICQLGVNSCLWHSTSSYSVYMRSL